MNIEKIKNQVTSYKNKPIKLKFNGNRNQIEEFEGTIIETYKSYILIGAEHIILLYFSTFSYISFLPIISEDLSIKFFLA